ncbi:hypothetical protein RhiirA4_454088 [Rhizophagus irregularis]|uniref:Uncharacterized protein n=1 Tax=Rhizophagus irregularis TaxID=588596 RepID=A0A2I1G243_9GLOM|nr:hypothetical protein RhiirA4_454088 [Rhizophagus irregularis]
MANLVLILPSNDAFCVDDNSAQEWENNHDDEKVCSAPGLLTPPAVSFQLVAGITTYSTAGDPIQLKEVQAVVSLAYVLMC